MSDTTAKLAARLAEALREMLSAGPGDPGYDGKVAEAEAAVSEAEKMGLIPPQD